MVATKVFKNGNSQAVRIPKDFHLDCSEVYMKKIGNQIMLIPKKQNISWDALWDLLDELDPVIPTEREQFSYTERNALII